MRKNEWKYGTRSPVEGITSFRTAATNSMPSTLVKNSTVAAVSREMNAAWLSICGSTACDCVASPSDDADRIVSMFHLRVSYDL